MAGWPVTRRHRAPSENGQLTLKSTRGRISGQRHRRFVGDRVYLRGQARPDSSSVDHVGRMSPEVSAVIVAIDLAEAIADTASVPEGTTASRCEGCGEIRLQYPMSLLDPWKKHFDYCAGETSGDGVPAAGPRQPRDGWPRGGTRRRTGAAQAANRKPGRRAGSGITTRWAPPTSRRRANSDRPSPGKACRSGPARGSRRC